MLSAIVRKIIKTADFKLNFYTAKDENFIAVLVSRGMFRGLALALALPSYGMQKNFRRFCNSHLVVDYRNL